MNYPQPESESQPTDLEILRHPRIDILKLLSEADYDAYRLCKELGLSYRNCYFHLKVLSQAGLIGFSVFKYHITQAGRQVISGM